MTKKEKELLLKDLCARLLYGVIVSTPNGNGHLNSISKSMFGNEYGVNINPLKREIFDDSSCDIKPYLRPLSSMTEEESVELANILRKWFYYALSQTDYTINPHLFDWLNEHHLDYRGLIEKGLALKAPKDMYK